MKGEENGGLRLLGGHRPSRRTVLGDESTANGKEGALIQHRARPVVRLEP